MTQRNTWRDGESHVLSAIPKKILSKKRLLDGMVTWGLPSEKVQEHRKLDFSTVWWAGIFISASVRRAFDELIFFTAISHCTFDNLTFAIQDFLDFVNCNFFQFI